MKLFKLSVVILLGLSACGQLHAQKLKEPKVILTIFSSQNLDKLRDVVFLTKSAKLKGKIYSYWGTFVTSEKIINKLVQVAQKFVACDPMERDVVFTVWLDKSAIEYKIIRSDGNTMLANLIAICDSAGLNDASERLSLFQY